MPKPKKGESKQNFLSRCTKEAVAEGKTAGQAFEFCVAEWGESELSKAAMTLSLPMEFKKEEGATRRLFEIQAYTGQKVRRWFGDVIIDVAGMKAKNSIPVLREHTRERIVGHSKKSWADKKNFYIQGEVSEATADGKEVAALSDEGFPWQASVGISVLKVESLKDDKTSAKVNGETVKGPLDIWRESLVDEVSFVALGADDRTAAIVLSSEGEDTSMNQLFNKEESPMDITLAILEKEAPELLKQIREAARAEGRKSGLTEGEINERTRVAAILEADADPAVTKKAITDGVSADGAFKLFYQAEKSKRAASLQEMEAAAPGSVGAKAPQDPPLAKTPQKELMEKAKKLALEKKITVHEAMKQIQAENPGLVDATLPKVHLVVND